MTRWGVATDTGGRRSVNEDAALAQPPVFVVADGMGGHARGEMASRTVVEAFRDLVESLDGSLVTPAEVERTLAAAGTAIRETMATVAGGLDGPDAVAGTTVAGVVRTERDGNPYWLVLNVGDSRVYRFADGALEQVSVDHSLVQELVDAGRLDPAQRRTHPRRNVITRAVGTGTRSDVDFWMLPVRPGERLLLCTDGLVGELEDEEIAEVLATEPEPDRAARALVARAVAGVAMDNVTVVVVDPLGPDDVHGVTEPRDGEPEAR